MEQLSRDLLALCAISQRMKGHGLRGLLISRLLDRAIGELSDMLDRIMTLKARAHGDN